MLDDVKQFIEECTTPSPGYGPSLPVSELYEEYCHWCDREPVGQMQFWRGVAELGVAKARVGRRTWYLDIVRR